MPRTRFTSEDEVAERNRQTLSLAGLAMALGLLVIALFLFHHLREKGLIEDCVMAGRADCVVIQQ